MCGVGEGEEAAYRSCGCNEMCGSTKTCRDTRDAARRGEQERCACARGKQPGYAETETPTNQRRGQNRAAALKGLRVSNETTDSKIKRSHTYA